MDGNWEIEGDKSLEHSGIAVTTTSNSYDPVDKKTADKKTRSNVHDHDTLIADSSSKSQYRRSSRGSRWEPAIPRNSGLLTPRTVTFTWPSGTLPTRGTTNNTYAQWRALSTYNWSAMVPTLYNFQVMYNRLYGTSQQPLFDNSLPSWAKNWQLMLWVSGEGNPKRLYDYGATGNPLTAWTNYDPSWNCPNQCTFDPNMPSYEMFQPLLFFMNMEAETRLQQWKTDRTAADNQMTAYDDFINGPTGLQAQILALNTAIHGPTGYLATIAELQAQLALSANVQTVRQALINQATDLLNTHVTFQQSYLKDTVVIPYHTFIAPETSSIYDIYSDMKNMFLQNMLLTADSYQKCNVINNENSPTQFLIKWLATQNTLTRQKHIQRYGTRNLPRSFLDDWWPILATSAAAVSIVSIALFAPEFIPVVNLVLTGAQVYTATDWEQRLTSLLTPFD
jgi:hypothetical protein